MNFDLEEEQRELCNSVRSVLERESPIALARAMYEGGGFPEQPWASARELGWTALTTSEADGGLGLGALELGLLAEELGRCLAPSPFMSTISQFLPALAVAGNPAQKSRFLAPAASGALIGTLAVCGPSGAFLALDDSLTAEPDGDRWRLSGTRDFVFDCAPMESACADEVIAVARVEAGDGIGLFIVSGSALETTRCKNLDASRPLASLRFSAVEIEAERVLGTPGASAEALAFIQNTAITALVFETVGAAQSLFDTTLDYAKQREQFGKPIGSFQAIQHKFSDLFIDLEKARSTAYFAAMTLDEGDPRASLAASMAKSAAGTCQRRLCKEGIQIHGGLGYTWEQDVHLYVKRLKANESLMGGSREHRDRIATLLGLSKTD